MTEIGFSDEQSIPLASPSVPQIPYYRADSAAAKTGNKTLVSLVNDLHRGDRREGLVWLVLALSAAALMVLSVW